MKKFTMRFYDGVDDDLMKLLPDEDPSNAIKDFLKRYINAPRFWKAVIDQIFKGMEPVLFRYDEHTGCKSIILRSKGGVFSKLITEHENGMITIGDTKQYHKYGMRSRRYGEGNQPKDFLYDVSEGDDTYLNYLIYERKLSEKETDEYDLEYIGLAD